MDDTVKINEIKIDDAVYSPLGKDTKEISSKKTIVVMDQGFLYPKSNFFGAQNQLKKDFRFMLSKAFFSFFCHKI